MEQNPTFVGRMRIALSAVADMGEISVRITNLFFLQFNSLQGFSGPQHDHFIGRHFEYQGQPNSQQFGRNDWDNRHTGFRLQQDMVQENTSSFSDIATSL